jgi:hypothetical protein
MTRNYPGRLIGCHFPPGGGHHVPKLSAPCADQDLAKMGDLSGLMSQLSLNNFR